MEIGEFGVGRPDFGGRRPRGEALGKKEKGDGTRLEQAKKLAAEQAKLAAEQAEKKLKAEQALAARGKRVNCVVCACFEFYYVYFERWSSCTGTSAVVFRAFLDTFMMF